ncbi:MAG: hypothetical protein MUE38_07845 [Flavihumibacter sp.]|nr:hypothetical protein [Flavihumibacter sp.]
MKILFLVLILLHAGIHFLGLRKSPQVGWLWVLTGILLLVFAYLYFREVNYAWLAGGVAILISQWLLISNWKDARYGTILNLLLLFIVLVEFGAFRMLKHFDILIASRLKNNPTNISQLITETDMVHLPPIVKKYLSYTNSVGKPKIFNFRAVFKGGMRSNPDDSYMPMKTIQYNFTEEPSRFFRFTATKAGMPVAGIHRYDSAGAIFKVKLLNWFPIIDAKGHQLKQAETVTVLNDFCFIAPGALIDKRIQWEQVNDTVVIARFTNPPFTVSAHLYFSAKGQLINFISNDRFETDGKTYKNYPWLTPVSDYKELNGYRLGTRAGLWYDRPDGKFQYGELELVEIEYNVTRSLD